MVGRQASALPGEGDLTCDTVGCFRLPDQTRPTHALIVEFKDESRRDTVQQLLTYAVRLWNEPPPGPDLAAFAHVGAVAVNLTGPAQPDAVSFTFPGLPECDFHFRIAQRNLREEDAAATLADVATGRTTRWLLAWIPLMHGGTEPGILEEWKQAALTEPDPHVRSTLGAFALLFAGLAGCLDLWKRGLEGWDMRTSQVVEEWRNEGRVEGRIEGLAEGQVRTCREILLALLEDRFGTLPEDLIQRVQAVKDVDRLKGALREVIHLHSLEELRLQ